MRLWAAIWGWWNCRRRAIDLEILWSACKDGARDLDHTRAPFAVHAFRDAAWDDPDDMRSSR